MIAAILLVQAVWPVGPMFVLSAPLLVMAAITAVYFLKLIREEKRLPITEAGSFYILAIFAYGALPLIGHLLSGMHLTVLSHGRLYALDPEPGEFASVGWMHVLFMVSFVLAYFSVRRARAPCNGTPLQMSADTLKVLVLLFLMLEGYFLYLKLFAGVDFSAAYDQSLYDHAQAFQQLSHAQQQLVVHPLGMLSAIKIGMVVWLTSNWHTRVHRWALFAVLAYIVLAYVMAPGGRFAVISVFLAAILSYHQFVRPIPVRRTMLFACLFFVAFFAANILRSGGGDLSGLGRLFDLASSNYGLIEDFFSFSNEFQISYGSIMSLQHTLADPMVKIPWQVRFYDVLLVIPQQLLPFAKVDPVAWYVQLSNNPDFFNYGVIAESLLGGGEAEIVLRGLVTGGLLAAIHNWHVSRPGQFWPTFFYIWLTIIIYQSFRNTSAYFLPLVLFQWLPVYFGVGILTILLKGKRQVVAAGP